MDTIIRLLSLILQTPKCLTPLVWGPAGVGKTSALNQLSFALNAYIETIIAAIRTPDEFKGLEIPDANGDLKTSPPPWTRRLLRAADDKKYKMVLGFFDEVSCAPPASQSALLRILLEKVVGDVQMPDHVRWIAAANPPGQAAGGWDLAFPLATRFVHLETGNPSASGWINWLSNDGAVREVMLVDPVEWDRQFNRVKGLFAGFIKRFPDALNEDPDKQAGRFPPAYTTPRTLEAAMRLYTTCRAVRDQDAEAPLLQAAIGQPNSTKFLAWVRESDLPDPEDLLKDPASWKPDPNRPDATFAVLNGVAYAASEKHAKQADRWKAAWKVIDRAIPHGKDIVIVAARHLAVEKNRPKDALRDPDVRRIVMQLSDVVRESGLMPDAK